MSLGIHVLGDWKSTRPLRKSTSLIVIHCSGTQPSADIGAASIHAMHKARKDSKGRPWQGIGYHFVIRRDGTVEAGEDLAKSGSHVSGYNDKSVGICMIGGINSFGSIDQNFTSAQYISLGGLLPKLLTLYPGAKLVGHRDLSPDLDGDGVIEKHERVKGCPSMDVAPFRKLLDV